MSKFVEIKPEDFSYSPFNLIGKDWMLVTAKNGEKCNSMTASWGGLGVMWHKNVAYVVVRPQRYTKEFIDSVDNFSLTFFDSSYKKVLTYLGTVSGRDEDKMQKSGLTTILENDIPYFDEAKIAIFCKKLYHQDYLPECFYDSSIAEEWYPNKDYHTLYIAEVTKILLKD